MVVKIHGLPPSVCTCTVAVVLKEVNVPYDIVPVNFPDMKGEDYLTQKHPFGQMPVLIEEDGFKLFESRAIARYLVAKHTPDSKLIPKDPKANALFEQAVSIENNDFYPYASGFALEKIFKPAHGVQGSDERAAEYVSTLEKKLEGYERILSKQKYLAGNELTLADLFHLPFGTFITEVLGFKGFEALPNVARWWNEISSRESWAEVMPGMLGYYLGQKK
ncbi:glutathione S-transferase [Fomitiporia mediterranea MF3/22]|uniref:glutathione S-transferase n=1 Tax=Fomitiporia mediterranea (strain MF3/22) TaxID=694068 RepID=UPI0004408652|nr:glutathione S-transferase [Fomitiporia mediterranea MF3/22]EJD00511.1 glutathione S-transferase [Fomitiporia mediterranea MF3/22]